MGKSIFFISGSMRRGGAERVISILANHYAEIGWKVVIVVMLFGEIEYKLDSRIKIVDLSLSNMSRLKMLPYWLKEIRKIVKVKNPKVIVSFAARVNIITQIACIGLNKKIIISERNDPYKDNRDCITKMAIKILYPRASRIVFQTKRAEGYFGKKIQNNGIIIPNPIKVYEYANSTKKKKIVSVGRLVIQKNQKLLVRAFAKVQERFSDYELWIYGEGELREELEVLAKQLGIENKFFMPGNVTDIHHQISDADMFVLSSDFEGFSNALLEALMMGLPCISTKCAGSDEVIIDGVNGLLVPVGDLNAMVYAILKLIEDDVFKKNIAQNAKKMTTKYEADRILRIWENVIGKN